MKRAILLDVACSRKHDDWEVVVLYAGAMVMTRTSRTLSTHQTTSGLDDHRFFLHETADRTLMQCMMAWCRANPS